MKVTFLGAAHEVTGSCTLLSVCGHSILIDCGMEQGLDLYENCPLPLAPGDIDCVLLTHAHIDHSGKLPMLTANGFKGSIYTTGATAKLCGIMLMDSAHIQETEAVWRNRKAKRSGGQPYVPLYSVADAHACLSQFVSCHYETDYDILPGVSIRFFDAGHLLGSASIQITVTENGTQQTLVFSGDVGNVQHPLIKDPTPPTHPDYVVVESTYGTRLHGKRTEYRTQLAHIIQQTLDRGGNVVVPSFAVGRTQELLYLIHEIQQMGLVKGHGTFPVWIDSPLAIEATKIYSTDMEEYYDTEALAKLRAGVDALHFPGLHFATTSQESMAINFDKTPKVILSASGMCEAGRIRHHLKHNLWREESTILFVGYQAEGTLGWTLLDGASSIKLFNEQILVHAHIETMEGISGHADRDMLLGWLGNLDAPPKQVFVNHGGDTVCDEFAAEVTRRLGYPAVAPYNGAEYDLTNGVCLNRGNDVRIQKKTRRDSTVFERLQLAGRRLLSVIEKNRGSSNKDLAKFTDQINDLCGKWDR